MEEIVIFMIITLIKILMLKTTTRMIIILIIMMITIVRIITSKGMISLCNRLYMLNCLFEPILKTWLLKRTFLIKLTNNNTYLSMQYKPTYPVNGFKGTLTEKNYPSVLKNFSHFLFLFKIFRFGYASACFILKLN